MFVIPLLHHHSHVDTSTVGGSLLWIGFAVIAVVALTMRWWGKK